MAYTRNMLPVRQQRSLAGRPGPHPRALLAPVPPYTVEDKVSGFFIRRGRDRSLTYPTPGLTHLSLRSTIV